MLAQVLADQRALVVVVPDHPDLAGPAQRLAAELGLPYGAERDRLVAPEVGYWLVLRHDRLQVEWAEKAAHAPGPVFADFITGPAGYRVRQGGMRQLIARAVGLKRGHDLLLLDPTAGLGRDAFVLASLGCAVTCVERNPVVWALLDDGLRRARAQAATRAAAERITLERGDGMEAMERRGGLPSRPDVIFLDPMFPASRSGAAVKKEQQLLRGLAQEQQDEARLLGLALTCARRRVVVKRPRLGPRMPGPPPAFAVTGESLRFDVYCSVDSRAADHGSAFGEDRGGLIQG